MTVENPAPPPAKRPWLKWVALGCVGLIVIIGCFVGVTFFVVKKATAGPEKAVKEFLAAAGAGDYAHAHSYFSAPLKEQQPLDKFTADAESHASMFKVKDTTFNNRSVNTTGAELSGTVTLEAGTQVPASFHLVQENDEWKLLSYHIGTGSE
jgi:Domain of unknown function (DUF4878)